MMSDMVCKDCGTTGEPARITKGSTMIELILWLCFLVPGLIYSFWRLSSRYDACACCGSVALVPVNSPVGRTLAQQHQPHMPATPVRKSNAGATGKMLGQAFRRYVLRK
jgi:hypothetical protein